MKSSETSFITLTVVAQVVLMAVTWPLWFSRTDYPAIPVFTSAVCFPIWLDQALSTMLIAGCVAFAVLQFQSIGRSSRIAAATSWLTASTGCCCFILFCCVALVVLDQHRLQPWHWLTILLLAEHCVLNSKDFRKVARVTLATIYIFAAASRFGPDVAAGMSGNVLKVVLQAANLAEIRPSDPRFFWLASMMNGVEFVIGFALLFQKSRPAAVIAAMLLHLTLIACLSPWGLNHHAGVLVWNLFLMVAIPTLFWNSGDRRRTSKDNSQNHPAGVTTDVTTDVTTVSMMAKGFIAVVVLIPASGLFGFADNWLAWQVYSPRPEVLKLTVDESQIQFLPESLQPFVQAPQPLRSDCSIRLDRWSLHSKLVPIYPEDRFQIATAKWIVDRAVQRGANRAAFKAQLTFPSRFPWWKRRTIDVDF